MKDRMYVLLCMCVTCEMTCSVFMPLNKSWFVLHSLGHIVFVLQNEAGNSTSVVILLHCQSSVVCKIWFQDSFTSQLYENTIQKETTTKL